MKLLKKKFKLLNNEFNLWDEKPTYMSHDIIEMLMDQIMEVKIQRLIYSIMKKCSKIFIHICRYHILSRPYW